MGKGKVDALGVPASGEDAVGVFCWSMINVGRELDTWKLYHMCTD